MAPTAILRSWTPSLALSWPSLANVALVGGLTLVYCIIAALLAPADDEFYYWCWAQSLQWSYYDHPAMTALMIRGSQELLGHNLVAVRFAACLTTALVFATILHLTRPRTLAWWLLATPLFSLGACIITPDTPLMLFWAAYVLWLVRIHDRLPVCSASKALCEPPLLALRTSDWLLGGVILGCGVVGKYTMALAVPAGFVSFLLAAQTRRWIGGYILHGIIAFLVASPILIFNLQRDFAPLLYQWKHSMGTPNPTWENFGNFIGIQILLFGTTPLVLLPWVLWNARSFLASPRLRVCLCLYALPFSFFLYKATRGHLEGNWALASYIAFWPLAAVWYERNRGTRFGEWGMRASFLPPILAVLAVAIHTVFPLSFMSPQSDRITRQADKHALAAVMAKDFQSRPPLPIFLDTYQWVALLRYHGVDARQFAGVSRPSHFSQTPETPADFQECYLIWDSVKPLPMSLIKTPVEVTRYPLVVRGTEVAVFVLWKTGKP